MKLGAVEFLPYRRNPKQPSPCEESSRYFEALDIVAEMLDGLPWMLAGGLSVPVTLGTFYRAHRDVDIVIPIEDFERLDTTLRGRGYALVMRFPISWRRHGLVLQIWTRASGLLVRKRCQRLSFVDRTREDGPECFVAKIDVYPFRFANGVLETCDYSHGVDATTPLVGRRVTLASGRVVPCLNLHYVDRLKAFRGGLIHRIDRAVIRHGPDAASRWFENQDRSQLTR
jgi:hypothetical protein